jgi:hypothetical protein
MRKTMVILGAIVLAAAGGPLFGATKTTGADFLLATTGARPDAMGQAFSAVADDINTLSFNPAGLGNIRLPEIAYSHYSFVSDIGFDFIGAGIPLGSAGVLGLGYMGVGVKPFNSTLDPMAVMGTDSENALMLGWGYAWDLFQAGVAVKYLWRNVGTAEGQGWAADVGIRMRPVRRLSLAMSLLNFGPPVVLTQNEPLPTTWKGGAAYRVFEDPQHTLDVSLEANVALQGQEPRYSMGAEYWFQEICALRAGYIANSSEEGLTAGVGIQFLGVQLDYAYQPFTHLGTTNRFSGMFRWEGPWIKGWELNPPKFLKVRSDEKGTLAEWEKPRGPVEGYELTVTCLEDGRTQVVNTSSPPTALDNLNPGTLYKAVVVALSRGKSRSMPSNTAYFQPQVAGGAEAPAAVQAVPTQSVTPAATQALAARPMTDEMGIQTGGYKALPVSLREGRRGVYGVVDVVGLKLWWDPYAAGPVLGYHVYRKSATGEILRMSDRPKATGPIWFTDPLGWEGSEWIVTAINQNDGTEKPVGSFVWTPSAQEMSMLQVKPAQRLKASAQKERKVFLDWDNDPRASGSKLLYARKTDHIFELYGKLDGKLPVSFLEILGSDEEFYFLVVNENQEGIWYSRTQEDTVKLFY